MFFKLGESCKFDRDQRYVDVFKDGVDHRGRAGEQTLTLPEKDAVLLCFRMNPEALPRFYTLKYAADLKAETERMAEVLKTAEAAEAFTPFPPLDDETPVAA
jgi:hypothetical protein